jgi:hypothetical protein
MLVKCAMQCSALRHWSGPCIFCPTLTPTDLHCSCMHTVQYCTVLYSMCIVLHCPACPVLACTFGHWSFPILHCPDFLCSVLSCIYPVLACPIRHCRPLSCTVLSGTVLCCTVANYPALSIIVLCTVSFTCSGQQCRSISADLDNIKSDFFPFDFKRSIMVC